MDERGLRDQLNRIAGEVPRSEMPPHLLSRARRRVAVTTSLGLVMLLGFISGAVALIDSSDRKPEFNPAKRSSVSRTTADGTLRCDARLTSDTVDPGEKIPLEISITNLSDRTQSVPGGISRMKVLDASGSTLFDSAEYEAGIHGPFILEEDLEPGATFKPFFRSIVKVRWPGPLEVVPGCPLFDDPLPALTLDVTVLGSTPAIGKALEAALAETHGLFQGCLPEPDGNWVTGVIEIPGAPDAPPMPARCSASVVEGEGFDVVELRLVSPPDAPDYEMPQYIIMVPELPGTGSMEALRWTFVVTDSETREVEDLVNVNRTRPADKMAPYFEFFDGEWNAGASRCGGMGSGSGILIISACPP